MANASFTICLIWLLLISRARITLLFVLGACKSSIGITISKNKDIYNVEKYLTHSNLNKTAPYTLLSVNDSSEYKICIKSSKVFQNSAFPGLLRIKTNTRLSELLMTSVIEDFFADMNVQYFAKYTTL